MSELRWLNVPFRYTTSADFERQLLSWLGEVFYEILPARGYEIREEQIYTSFHIARAFCRKEALLAEAGSGTGKTFAYLLPAVCYARFSGKPIILSSASALLQEQLVGEKGDMAELSRLLDLKIDVRVAKDQRNYLCQKKADAALELDEHRSTRRLRQWQKQTKLGDRAELPELSDQLWQLVAWDETLSCDQCIRRGYCQVAKNRLHIWAARDFVVSSHDQFFRHLWSKADREEEGLPPLLPEASALIFDEGHLLERPAINGLGQSLREQSLLGVHETMWTYRRVLGAKLCALLELMEVATRRFFATLRQSIRPDVSAERWTVTVSQPLADRATRLLEVVQRAEEQLALDADLLVGTAVEGEFHMANQRLEQAGKALNRLCHHLADSVIWWETTTETLWVLPDSFGALIGQELSRERLPLVFTSATLQTAGSFAGMKQLLGLPGAKESRVGTSFHLAQQVVAYLPSETSPSFVARAEQCLQLLIENQGRALVLLQNAAEIASWQSFLQDKILPFPVIWEGDGERSWLLAKFQEQVSSVLIGSSFWEGVDVPGETLSLVIVFSLPYPEPDPLLISKRQSAAQAGLDPWLTIDQTEMLIKLRQGFGRLIRTAADRGIIAVLDLGEQAEHRQLITEALPDGSPVFNQFAEAKAAIY